MKRMLLTVVLVLLCGSAEAQESPFTVSCGACLVAPNIVEAFRHADDSGFRWDMADSSFNYRAMIPGDIKVTDYLRLGGMAADVEDPDWSFDDHPDFFEKIREHEDLPLTGVEGETETPEPWHICEPGCIPDLIPGLDHSDSVNWREGNMQTFGSVYIVDRVISWNGERKGHCTYIVQVMPDPNEGDPGGGAGDDLMGDRGYNAGGFAYMDLATCPKCGAQRKLGWRRRKSKDPRDRECPDKIKCAE